MVGWMYVVRPAVLSDVGELVDRIKPGSLRCCCCSSSVVCGRGDSCNNIMW